MAWILTRLIENSEKNGLHKKLSLIVTNKNIFYLCIAVWARVMIVAGSSS